MCIIQAWRKYLFHILYNYILPCKGCSRYSLLMRIFTMNNWCVVSLLVFLNTIPHLQEFIYVSQKHTQITRDRERKENIKLQKYYKTLSTSPLKTYLRYPWTSGVNDLNVFVTQSQHLIHCSSKSRQNYDITLVNNFKLFLPILDRDILHFHFLQSLPQDLNASAVDTNYENKNRRAAYTKESLAIFKIKNNFKEEGE